MSKYNIEKFKHVTVALNTPFAKDGSVDVEAVKAVSRYFRDKGVKQMYVCGSTGEGFLLDTEERKLVAETVVRSRTGYEYYCTCRMCIYQTFLYSGRTC